MSEKRVEAAVAYVEREDGKLLCVWNKRYGGWTLPGGKVEPGESTFTAVERELCEETGLHVDAMSAHVVIFHGEHGIKVESTRGSYVWIFALAAVGAPKPMETPIAWLSRKEFLEQSPFAPFYEKVFAEVPALEHVWTSKGVIAIADEDSVLRAEHASRAERSIREANEKFAKGLMRSLPEADQEALAAMDRIDAALPERVRKFRPLAERVLVRLEKGQERFGVLFIPESVREKARGVARAGLVVRCGPGEELPDGRVLPLLVRVGDRVLFNKGAANVVFREGGDEYAILHANMTESGVEDWRGAGAGAGDILAVVSEGAVVG